MESAMLDLEGEALVRWLAEPRRVPGPRASLEDAAACVGTSSTVRERRAQRGSAVTFGGGGRTTTRPPFITNMTLS